MKRSSHRAPGTVAGRFALLARSSLIALAGSSLSACVDGESSRAAVGGADPAWRGGYAWRVGDEPLVTIGDLDGPEFIGGLGHVLGRNWGRAAALLPDGRIAIADGQRREVRLYDPAGNRLLAFGRRGNGPGEFRDLEGVAYFAGGDSLVVWDVAIAGSDPRATIFTTSGEYVRSAGGIPRELPLILGPLADGSLVLSSVAPATADIMRPAPAGIRRPPLTIRRLLPTGEPATQMGPFPGPEEYRSEAGLYSPMLSRRTTVFGVGLAHVYAGDTADFEVVALDPASGDVVRRMSRPAAGVEMSPEQLRENRQGWAAAMQSMPENARAFYAPAEQMPAPERLPFFDEIREDSEGNVWVRNRLGSDGEDQIWSVFDPHGVWLGEVGVPRRLQVHAIGSDAILVSSYDELRVARVHLYPILK